MSIIQVEDLVSYQLRSNFLNTIKDGVGERLITINDAFLNTPGFKAAGWRTNPSSRQRTHSPPIPTAVTSEYFRAPLAAGLSTTNLDEENEEGGMVTGGGAENTFGPGLGVKRRRKREQMEEEDSSDLSDDSDEEDSRAAQQIKFAKMPIRLRSGSSPGRKEEPKNPSNLASPSRKPGARRGSHSTVEAIKQRARRDTATSSDMSSDNDFDNSAFKARQARNTVGEEDDGLQPVTRQQSDLLPEEMEDDSLGSYMSSGFAGSMDSQSMMDSVRLSQVEDHHVGTLPPNLPTKPPHASSPKKPKITITATPAALPALPPARPISYIKPVSLLSMQIKAKRTKPFMPFEKFAPFTGQGDPNPINLHIWAPFSKAEEGEEKHFEVLIRRIINDPEQGNREATVSDLIGLSLWRYIEEKLEPKLSGPQLNVNRWNLRLMEDDEIDFDFPPLDRTKTVIAFANVNSSAGRGGRRSKKTHDEFGLVEANDTEFIDNCRKTPQYTQESEGAPAGSAADDDFPPAAPRKSSVNKQDAPPTGVQANLRNLNPLLTTMAKSTALADTPAPLVRDPSARPGVQKLLKIHIMSSDLTPGQSVTLNVSTGTYFAEVLDIVCRKRDLDKALHVLKLSGTQAVVQPDRTVGSIGSRTELDLWRRRFGTDGPLGVAGSPSAHSPRTPLIGGSLVLDAPGFPDPSISKPPKKSRKIPGFMTASLASGLNLTASGAGAHPLAQTQKLDEPGSTAANYRKWTVWRKQPMRFVGMNERVVAIDGEYLHIMPGSAGRKTEEGGKATTVHFSNVVGCKQVRRHPSNFKVRIWRGDQPKEYEFEAKSGAEAGEIVEQIKKGIAPYQTKSGVAI